MSRTWWDPSGIAVPPGYRIELVAEKLTFPTGVAFGDGGELYVVESGYSIGAVVATPRILEITEGGEPRVVHAGQSHAPWNGIAFHDGQFYVAQGGQKEGGRVVRISQDGEVDVLVDQLPSQGDHHTNGPIVTDDGWVYFGQGTVTNSGVVGVDSDAFGWLKDHPDLHDTPCADVTLTGVNYESANPLTVADDKVTTGYDVRGGRPVFGSADWLWRVDRDGGAAQWFGWPDFAEGRPLTFDAYAESDGDPKGFVLAEHPRIPPEPVARFAVHASADGLDIAPESFGHRGQAFVAQFGDMSPNVGKVVSPVGFDVVRVDLATGAIEQFARNEGEQLGPASRIGALRGRLRDPAHDRQGSRPAARQRPAVAHRQGGRRCGPLGSRSPSPQGPTVTPDSAHEARGAVLFRKLCYQCHPGGDSGLGPALNDKPLPEAAIRTQIREGVGAMPSFGEDQLTDDDVDAIADYIQEMRATPRPSRGARIVP